MKNKWFASLVAGLSAFALLGVVPHTGGARPGMVRTQPGMQPMPAMNPTKTIIVNPPVRQGPQPAINATKTIIVNPPVQQGPQPALNATKTIIVNPPVQQGPQPALNATKTIIVNPPVQQGPQPQLSPVRPVPAQANGELQSGARPPR